MPKGAIILDRCVVYGLSLRCLRVDRIDQDGSADTHPHLRANLFASGHRSRLRMNCGRSPHTQRRYNAA